uniref:NADH-ubiquinone oxidoreductase chain 2 n=1 Tax=Coraebus cavifrons TaxID=2823020 RepID=A0A8A6W4Y8_9COLE|nr:NADH dehydrogenase subunit 2 [Coraebus cavifrons]QTK22423.1 NADH dehydrogenase subunit 2 [Coraebus cavifrons]
MWYFYKNLFIFTLISSTLLVISTNSWVAMWIGLEINLLSFIPLIKEEKNTRTSEAAMKYFIIQAMASIIILGSLLNNIVINSMTSNLIINTPTLVIVLSALITKMGAAPFHFWFPEVMEGISWINALLLLTWQKIAPLTMILYLKLNNWLMVFLVFCVVTGSLVGLNQTSLRKILAYSSINHMGWMLGALMFTKSIWMIYLIIYCLMNTMMVLEFKKFNLNHLEQLFMSSMNNPLSKSVFILNFFSLGGIPPFIGFLPKWLTIQILVEHQLLIPSVLMIIVTLVTLFYYLRITLIPLTLKVKSSSLVIKSAQKNSNKYLMMTNTAVIMSLVLSPLILNWI